jgi:hypothetical protein
LLRSRNVLVLVLRLKAQDSWSCPGCASILIIQKSQSRSQELSILVLSQSIGLVLYGLHYSIVGIAVLLAKYLAVGDVARFVCLLTQDSGQKPLEMA